MDERDCLAERFEEHRAHLRAVSYRMLGSLTDADDAVQEVWLRFSRSDTSGIESLRASFSFMSRRSARAGSLPRHERVGAPAQSPSDQGRIS